MADKVEGTSLVRAWREYLGLTQEGLAVRVGISRPAVAKFESSTDRPRRVTLHKLANAGSYGWSNQWLNRGRTGPWLAG